MVANPPWKLHRADVLALTMVRAALRDQHRIAVFEPIELACAGDLRIKIALVSCHQDRERCEGDILGHDPGHRAKRLGVGDHQARRMRERVHHGRKLGLARHVRMRSGIEHVAYGHLLGEDEPAFGCRGVDGNHEHDVVAGFEQVAHHAPGFLRAGGDRADELLELVDARSRQGACEQAPMRRVRVRFQRRLRLLFAHEVALAHDDRIRNASLFEQAYERAIGIRKSLDAIRHEHGRIGRIEHAARLPDAQGSELSLIVHAGRVDDEHGSQGRELHGLAHRIGRRAGHLRNHGKVLSDDRIDQARLACVARAEESDVDPFAARRAVQSHRILPPRT